MWARTNINIHKLLSWQRTYGVLLIINPQNSFFKITVTKKKDKTKNKASECPYVNRFEHGIATPH
jgi:hypothetical protein